jgi:nicotinamidase-related amidase
MVFPMNKSSENIADPKKFFFQPEINTSLILFIDMQEKFLGAMPDTIQDTILRQKILLESAKLLQVPVVVTEQYPKGLGHTIIEIADIFEPGWPIFEKSTFSCLGSTDVRMELKKKNFNSVILLGIENHVCVLQTAIDLLAEGFQTIILKDAVNSRKTIDMETGFETAKAAGAHLMTVESFVFMLMKDSRHPFFRDISKLLK